MPKSGKITHRTTARRSVRRKAKSSAAALGRSLKSKTVPLSTCIAAMNIQRPCSLTLFGITAAETVDLMFPNWLNKAFIRYGNDAVYRPYDLNMPADLLRRPATHYQMDSPITEHGKVCAALIARGILIANYRASAIFTSPELRCIETAHSIRRVLKYTSDCELCVEPSLAEYERFRQDAQKYWLSSERLQDKGIETSKTYRSVLTADQLQRKESAHEFVQRIQHFYKRIIANFNGECAMVVSNITGIFVLADGTAESPWHLQAPHGYMNSCHVFAMEVKPDGTVKPIQNPILPLTRTLYDAELQQKIEKSKTKN